MRISLGEHEYARFKIKESMNSQKIYLSFDGSESYQHFKKVSSLKASLSF